MLGGDGRDSDVLDVSVVVVSNSAGCRRRGRNGGVVVDEDVADDEWSLG